MEFICLASGSSGNSYVIKHGRDCILMECGLDYRKLVGKLMDNDFCASDITHVVCTHHHHDHIESISSWIGRGCIVVAPKDCLSASEQTCVNVTAAADGSKGDLSDNVKILAFKVNHDCEALGYILFFKDTKESVLFINDTYYFDFKYCNYKFDYIFIECNHIRQQLEAIKKDATLKGKPVVKYERQSQCHMSLACLKKFLGAMNLSQTKSIFLMHQSAECCNPEICRNEIKATFNKPTFYCGRNGGIF